MRLILVTLLVLPLGGCGGSGSPAAADLAVPWDFTFRSNCGQPGEGGNSLGVGQFCQKSSDCRMNAKATLCTTIADPDNYFCTFPCSKNGPPDQCGENARCACQGSCGCFPTRCDGAPADGGAGGG